MGPRADEYASSRRRVLSNLAADLRQLGHHKWVCELDESTLTRRRRVLGDDHPDTLASANNLAVDYASSGTTSGADSQTTGPIAGPVLTYNLYQPVVRCQGARLAAVPHRRTVNPSADAFQGSNP